MIQQTDTHRYFAHQLPAAFCLTPLLLHLPRLPGNSSVPPTLLGLSVRRLLETQKVNLSSYLQPQLSFLPGWPDLGHCWLALGPFAADLLSYRYLSIGWAHSELVFQVPGEPFPSLRPGTVLKQPL